MPRRRRITVQALPAAAAGTGSGALAPRKQALRLVVTSPGRFLLDQGVDGLPVAEVVRRDGVELHAGPFDEAGPGHRGYCAQGCCPARNVAIAVPWAPGT